MIKEENINCTIEALILASPEPLPVKKISDVMDDVSVARIRQGIADLNNVYMGCGCSFRIRELAGGYQVYILPDFEQPIKNLLTKERTVRLTRAALETLAIIAFKQPVAKTDIEHIRGVASDGVIHNLMERNLILIAGRAETPGRPLLYKTSQEFLKFFGLNRLSDLPRMDEIEEMIRQSDTPKEQTAFEFGDNGNGKDATLSFVDIDDGAEASADGDENEMSTEMAKVDREEAGIEFDEDADDIEDEFDDLEEGEESEEKPLSELINESDMFGTNGDNEPLLDTSDTDDGANDDAEEWSDDMLEAIEDEVALPDAEFEPTAPPNRFSEEIKTMVKALELYEPIPDIPPPISYSIPEDFAEASRTADEDEPEVQSEAIDDNGGEA